MCIKLEQDAVRKRLFINMSRIQVKTCLDCGKSAKTGSAFTRHINRCPVALGLSNRKRVRNRDEIEGYEDLFNRRKIRNRDEIEGSEDQFKRRKVRDRNEIEEYEDLSDRKEIQNRIEIEVYEDDFGDSSFNLNVQAVELVS